MRLAIEAMAMDIEQPRKTTLEAGTRRPFRLPPTMGPGPIVGSLDTLIIGTLPSIPEMLLSARTRLSVPSLLQTPSLGRCTACLHHHNSHSNRLRQLLRKQQRRARMER
jgi:hypothetical protein